MTLSELFYLTAGVVVCIGLKAWLRHGTGVGKPFSDGHYSTRKNLLIFTPIFLLLILVFLFTQQFA